jgi:hypothetical protein
LRIVVFKLAHGVWRRRGEAASARLSAAPYSAHHKLYSEAVVSSIVSAVALAEVGRFREAVQYVQRAAKALYEAAKETFEKVKVTVQRLVELFVEAVARVLAWVDEHKAYLFLMAAVAAGVVALSVALNLWGLVELEKLAHVASAPFVAGLADAGGRAAERFRALAEGYERWKMEEKVISEIINAPLNGERSFSKLTGLKNLPKPLVELRKALKDIEDKTKIDEVEKDAAVVAALVLYKTLINNAGAYGEWAGWYRRARGLVKEREFAVTAEEVKRLREAHRRLEEVAEQVRRELNAVLALYASHSRDLYEKLRPHLEVDVKKAEGLAEARRIELSKYSNANMGTKVYAALLSAARGGIYGHAAMLLAGEGALADIVLSAPMTAYKKAKRVAKGRGEAVDPSRSRVGAAGWEDRAASALLRYLLSRTVSEDLVFRRVEGGFEVFRAYGGVETRIDELKIGESVARSEAGEEVLRRFVEEAKRQVPDLSGFKKIWQALPWFATDASFTGKQIDAGTAHLWQLKWYIALFGEPESISGRADVAEEGIKPIVKMRWRRERLDRIIAEEGEELKPLLGRAVKSWRELVDAIDWSWVLERVRDLVNELKPWIGPEEVSNAEREGLMRRMFGELALIVHFAEARRGKNDSEWREERVKRLAKAVEALSGGRIAGDYAERLARAIIYYAEGKKTYAERRIESLAKEVGVSNKEVWGVVDFVLSDMYCLTKDCARDAVVRKFVEPALELIMLDKALNNEFDRERARLLFGGMYATAVAGDGHVGPDIVTLTAGGELGGGAALLRLATLHLLNQLLPKKFKFNAGIYVEKDRYYRIAAYGENAARFKRFLAVTAPSAGGGYLSDKFDEFVKEAQVEVQLDKNSIRLTDGGNVAADLTISEAGVAVKYTVYLRKYILLEFQSTDRSRVELAARLLRLAGVSAEVKRKEDGRGEWRVEATTDMLAAGREELGKALAEIVKTARDNGWVDEKKARRWLEKLEKGVATWEGKKFSMRVVEGALEVRFNPTSRESLEEVAREFKAMGLEEGVHFTVRWGGERGHVYLLAEGVRRLAWVSTYGEEGQRRRAAGFLKFLEEKAKKRGGEVLRKLEALVEEGKGRGALRLVGLERGGVKVLDVKTEEKGDKLYITLSAEVDGAAGEYKLTFTREKDGTRRLQFYVRGGAARAVKLIEVLTGEKPQVTEMPDGRTRIRGSERHIDALARYEELRETIERWSNQ